MILVLKVSGILRHRVTAMLWCILVWCEIDMNKYDGSNNSLNSLRKDFSSIYAVTDEKFKNVSSFCKSKKVWFLFFLEKQTNS